MIRETWTDLRLLLGSRFQVLGGALVVASLLVGVLEAGLLIVVVRVALLVAEGSERSSLDLPALGDSIDSPGWALVGAGAAGVCVLLLHVLIARLMANLSGSVLRRARSDAVRAFQRASWARQSSEREGALQETISTLAVQSSGVVIFFANFVSAAIGLVALLVVAAILDPIVTAAVITLGGLLVAALRPIGAMTRRRSEEFVAANSYYAEEVSRWSAMSMELRAFGVDEQEAARLESLGDSTSRSLQAARFTTRVGAWLYTDLAILFLVGAVGGLRALSDVDLAAVGAVVLLVFRSLSYAQQAQSNLQQVHEHAPNLASLRSRLRSLDDDSESFGSIRVGSIGELHLKGVSYEYEPGRSGIDSLTLHIHQGQVLGVIGPSGGGKSTLAQVVLRLRTPTSGEVCVDGVPYERIHPDDWHRLIALVPQEVRLFEGSVRDNISMLRTWISDRDVEDAARAAQVFDVISALPDGFDTKLGPRGGGLSGGQRQRIAIARALAGNPQLVVLDEPTSALDAVSESLIQQTIEGLRGRVTMVIIAHRLSTLASCDRVIAVVNGRIAAAGTLDEVSRAVSLDEADLIE